MIYEITDAELAGEFVDQLGLDLQDESVTMLVSQIRRVRRPIHAPPQG